MIFKQRDDNDLTRECSRRAPTWYSWRYMNVCLQRGNVFPGTHRLGLCPRDVSNTGCRYYSHHGLDKGSCTTSWWLAAVGKDGTPGCPSGVGSWRSAGGDHVLWIYWRVGYSSASSRSNTSDSQTGSLWKYAEAVASPRNVVYPRWGLSWRYNHSARRPRIYDRWYNPQWERWADPGDPLQFVFSATRPCQDVRYGRHHPNLRRTTSRGTDERPGLVAPAGHCGLTLFGSDHPSATPRWCPWFYHTSTGSYPASPRPDH